ncbi:MAG TPA: heme exporter protein CcmB, partial [Planctomycetota bacterium]|nr:heme exporter protein CcmB [Planctomycetota bacterium]
MRSLRLYGRLIYWDLVRELRRKDVFLNMVLFGVLVLFLVNMGLAPLFLRLRGATGSELLSQIDPEFFGQLDERIGAIIFWIGVLFAGSVGLGQSLAAEREGGALTGLLLSPADLGIFYLSKVTATWIYVVLMEICLIGGYIVLFDFNDWRVLGPMIVSLALFSLG